jgi:hypothetical protein
MSNRCMGSHKRNLANNMRGGGGRKTLYLIFWNSQIRVKDWSESVISIRTPLSPTLTPAFLFTLFKPESKQLFLGEKVFERQFPLFSHKLRLCGQYHQVLLLYTHKTTDDLHCRLNSIPEQLIFTQPSYILPEFILWNCGKFAKTHSRNKGIFSKPKKSISVNYILPRVHCKADKCP